MVKILTNQSGTKGFNFEEFFITDPYVTECMRSTVDPKKYYGLTDEQLIHFKHLKPLEEEPQPTYEELVKDLKGMKFFIVRWCGDANTPSSYTVDDPIKFFDEYHYGDDVVKDLKGMSVGEKYNVDEMMQDIEILRYE
tara:strand:- start:7 stop:420 length:414 start_codon:yes stop_codon:yes gene_type:complete